SRQPITFWFRPQRAQALSALILPTPLKETFSPLPADISLEIAFPCGHLFAWHALIATLKSMDDSDILAVLSLAAERSLRSHSGRQYPPKAHSHVLELYTNSDDETLEHLKWKGQLGFNKLASERFAVGIPGPVNTSTLQEGLLARLSFLLNSGVGFPPNTSHLTATFDAVAGALICDGGLAKLRTWLNIQLDDVMVGIEKTAGLIDKTLERREMPQEARESLINFKRAEFGRYHVSDDPIKGNELDGFTTLSLDDPAPTPGPVTIGVKRPADNTNSDSRRKRRKGL
ncbi:hypothetical protein DFH09DRAFT_1427163, partial [Mycena vulgaris]